MTQLLNKQLIYSLILITSGASAATPAQEAQAWIEKRMKLVKNPEKISGKKVSDAFDTSQCAKVPGSAWGKLILLDRPITHEFKFAQGCDLQGKVTLTREPFDVDLEVRHIPDVNRVQGEVEVEIDPNLMDQEADLLVHGKQATLVKAAPGAKSTSVASEQLAFNADYKLVIGVDGKVKEDRNGTIQVNRFQGKPLSLSVPIQPSFAKK